MRHTTSNEGSLLTTPFDYAMRLVKQGFTGKEFWDQSQESLMPAEYVHAVLVELAQLPTTAQLYSYTRNA